MQPSPSPLSPRPRRPSPPARRGLSGAVRALLALVALAAACALSALRPARAADAAGEGAPRAWADALRVRGPFGSSVGAGGELSGGRGGRGPALRLRLNLTLDLSPFGGGEP